MMRLLVTSKQTGHRIWGRDLATAYFQTRPGIMTYGPGLPRYENTKAGRSLTGILERFPSDALLIYNWYPRELKAIDIPTLGVIVDAYPGFGDSAIREIWENRRLPDLFLCQSRAVMPFAKAILPSVPQVLWPYAVDADVYKPMPERDIDVAACFNVNPKCYPLRATIKEMLAAHPEWITEAGKMEFCQHAQTLGRSKITINSGNHWQALNWRIFEAMCAGSLLMTDRVVSLPELGYLPGEHYVKFSTVADLERKIKYYLARPDERKEIADAGSIRATIRDSLRPRTDDLMAICRDLLDRGADYASRDRGCT